MKKKRFLKTTLPMLVLLALVFPTGGCQRSPSAVQPAVSIPTPAAAPTTPFPAIPYELVSIESLIGYVGDLTAIQPYSGWRNSASSGEAEALDYVTTKLRGFSNLLGMGLELERQGFDVYLSTEIWDSGLTLSINNQEVKVPAEGLRGSRFDQNLAVYFDSDGSISDTDPDPMIAAGLPLVLRDEDELNSLTAGDLTGRILFLDYSLIDTSFGTAAIASNPSYENTGRLLTMIDQGLAGVVLVTRYSNKPGESHGTVLGDGANFGLQVPSRRVPILYVRIEDLKPAGIYGWDDFKKVESARLMLDSDVFSPGKSGNLIARIPGADPSKAVILGAHIDSPNGPGGFDDGSGSAALLEVARVLEVSQLKPPVDVYLAWFGGHEIGIYGSAYFASTHQELLDRTLAQVQMDGLGHPLDGVSSKITMMITSYGRFGNEHLPLPDFLANAVAPRGLNLDRVVEYGLIADNSNFDIFNVPNVFLGYLNARDWELKGSTYNHYSNHWHDPYETVDRVREVGDTFVDMTRVLLAAALEIGRLQPDLRVPPAPIRRALFVASHTASVSLTTSMLRELGMALAWEGFDVDLVPYGQVITSSDLENVGLVVLPPTLDYPGPENTSWSGSELTLLDDYVARGGFLLVINSAFNYSMKRRLNEKNEDARALNPFLKPMGIAFKFGDTGSGNIARVVSDHPLVANAAYLSLYGDNAVPFSMKTGLELIQAPSSPLVGLVDYGNRHGQVLVIGDLGLLQADDIGAKNIQFLQNIAHYAMTR
jgi:hypothetical protein